MRREISKMRLLTFVLATITGLGFLTVTAFAQIGISISDISMPEGNSGTVNFNFNVHLSGPVPPNQTVTVNFATADGTATAGSGDYVSSSGTLTFLPGDQNKLIPPITINGDLSSEPNETFFVNLSNPSANATIVDGQGVGTIDNDDQQSPPPPPPPHRRQPSAIL